MRAKSQDSVSKPRPAAKRAICILKILWSIWVFVNYGNKNAVCTISVILRDLKVDATDLEEVWLNGNIFDICATVPMHALPVYAEILHLCVSRKRFMTS